MISRFAKRFEWSDGFTTAMQEAFEADGFLVIDGFASTDSCDKLLDQSEKLINKFDAKAHSVAFSATGQTHAASDYFIKSATDISFFLEEEALERTNLKVWLVTERENFMSARHLENQI